MSDNVPDNGDEMKSSLRYERPAIMVAALITIAVLAISSMVIQDATRLTVIVSACTAWLGILYTAWQNSQQKQMQIAHKEECHKTQEIAKEAKSEVAEFKEITREAIKKLSDSDKPKDGSGPVPIADIPKQ